MKGLYYKTKEEIELIRESSLLVGKTLAEVAKVIKPGVTTLSLDKVAYEFINDNKAIPAFLNYSGFPNSLCISVNAQVVHGIPGKYELKDGDIVSVDCGVIKNKFFGESFIFTLKEYTSNAYCSSMRGAQEGLQYVMIPGKRIACVSREKNGKC